MSVNLKQIRAAFDELIKNNGSVLPSSVATKQATAVAPVKIPSDNVTPTGSPNQFTPSFSAEVSDFNLEETYTLEQILALVGAHDDQKRAMGLHPKPIPAC